MAKKHRLFRRRKVLKTIGAGVVGGAVLTGSASARRGNLVSTVARDGYYSHFPLDVPTWKRLQNPFDTTGPEGARWKAQPAARGSIRCLVEDIAEPGNAGFEVPVGPVGEIDSVTIDAETIETQRNGAALYALALYLDLDGDGEFFVWEDGKGTEQQFAGFGGDGEGIAFAPADGKSTFDEDTVFPVVLPDGLDFGPGDTWEEVVDAVGGETEAAIYVGVLGNEAGAGREEIVIHSVDIDRD